MCFETQVYTCPMPPGCPGGNLTCIGSIQQCGAPVCARGYEGPLCSVCADGYGKGASTCVNCDANKGIHQFVNAVTPLVIILAIGIMTRSNLQGDQEKGTNVLTKIILNYVQLIALTRQLEVPWPRALVEMLEAQQAASDGGTNLSAECRAASGYPGPAWARLG